MKNQKLGLLFSIILLNLLFFTFSQVFAANSLVPCGPGFPSPDNVCRLCHFFILFRNIVDFILFDIVPPLAALMIAIGGFYLIFSEGNPENIKKGQGVFRAVVISLLIIYSSWLIVNLFFQIIGVETWTGLQNWWQIKCD